MYALAAAASPAEGSALHELVEQAGPQLAASLPEAPAPPAVRSEAAALPGLSRQALSQTVETLASPAMEGRAPMSRGSRLAREYIIEKMRSYGIEPGGEDESYVEGVHKRLLGYKIGHNVVGYVPGRTKPEECVYIDAHYDHWGKAGGELQPGANDNASGVAVMLELGRILSQVRPDRTVVFLASDYEEGALLPMLGAIKGANYHVRSPFCDKERIKGAIVLDTLGGPFVAGIKPQLFLVGSESSPQTYSLAAKAAEDGPVAIKRLGIYAIEPLGKIIPRADYGAYRRIGVPFIFATSGLSADYHSASDTIDTLDFDFMGKAGAEILRLVLAMSSGSFEASFAARPDEVIDWDQELSSLDRILEEILGLESPSPEKASHLKKLRTRRERLRAQSAPGKPDRRSVRKSAQRAVLDILKMNGSLKFWEHLYRTHGVPHEKD